MLLLLDYLEENNRQHGTVPLPGDCLKLSCKEDALKKTTIIVLSLPVVYAFSFWYSLHKIDNFCNGIDTSTNLGDLQSMAQRAGVDLRGPVEMLDSSGHKYSYAIAASAFTVGEYACSIHGSPLTNKVVSKRLGY